MFVGLGFHEQSFCFQLLHDQWARFPNVHARKFSRNGQEFPPEINDLFFVELLTLGNVKVNRVMPGSNGHGSGPEFHVYSFILDNSCLNFAVHPFNLYLLPFSVLFVAFVFGVHHHVLVYCFQIRERGLVLGAPVNDSPAPVHKVISRELFECGVHGFYHICIKGELFS